MSDKKNNIADEEVQASSRRINKAERNSKLGKYQMH